MKDVLHGRHKEEEMEEENCGRGDEIVVEAYDRQTTKKGYNSISGWQLWISLSIESVMECS
jgi:hypothetical protein